MGSYCMYRAATIAASGHWPVKTTESVCYALLKGSLRASKPATYENFAITFRKERSDLILGSKAYECGQGGIRSSEIARP